MVWTMVAHIPAAHRHVDLVLPTQYRHATLARARVRWKRGPGGLDEGSADCPRGSLPRCFRHLSRLCPVQTRSCQQRTRSCFLQTQLCPEETRSCLEQSRSCFPQTRSWLLGHGCIRTKHGHGSCRHSHVRSNHDHVSCRHNHVRTKHDHVSCRHNHGRPDTTMFPANTVMVFRSTHVDLRCTRCGSPFQRAGDASANRTCDGAGVSVQASGRV